MSLKQRNTNAGSTTEYLSRLSDELLCHILSFLPLREVICISVQNKKLCHAVQLHLNLRKMINFTNDKIHSYMSGKITDDVLMKLLRMCRRVETIRGLHPRQVEKRRQRGRKCLSIPGVIDAMSSCKHLKGVEISSIRMLEAIMDNLPHVEIIGHFRNHDGQFPNAPQRFLNLPHSPKITCLHLTGIEVTKLPCMPQLEFLYLQWVRFTDLNPFQHFLAPTLQTFTMKNCAGPTDALRYVPLAVALANAPNLRHLELIRVPVLGGLFQRVVEDHWKSKAFHKLTNIITGTCRNLLETDIGFLIITSTSSLSTLKLQPSLSKDSLMLSLMHCHAKFLQMKNLYIGYVNEFPPKGGWSNEELMMEGLADVVEVSSPITDTGMRIANKIFPNLEVLAINWSPHLLYPMAWLLPGATGFKCLQDLVIKKCHCLKLDDFEQFLQMLPAIECVVLEDVFLAPPRGCNHVGLSAGTGLGMSSAIINQNPLNLGNNDGGAINVNDGNEAENNDANNEDVELPNEEENEHVKLLEDYVGEEDERMIQKTSNSSWVEDRDQGANPHVREINKHAGVERVSKFDKPGTSGTNACATVEANEKDNLDNCDQACQATNEDIRQAMRKPQTNMKILHPSSSGVAAWNTAASSNNADVKTNKKNKRNKKSSRRKMLDKSTSTSDPFYNDEPTDYSTNIVSDSLRSLTFVACGITRADISCPKLEHAEINACARFRSFKFLSATNLLTVHVSECPQTDDELLVKSIAKLPAKRDRFISIKVIGEFSLMDLKRLFTNDSTIGYHFLFVHDHIPSDQVRVLNRQCVRRWMKLCHNINYDLLKETNFGHSKKSVSTNKKSGTHRTWQQQINCEEGEYTICTDIPWLQDLLSSKDNRGPYTFSEDYAPESLGFKCVQDCLPKLKSSIAEAKKNGANLHLYTIGVYIYHGVKK